PDPRTRAARLFGRLLLAELDAATLDELRAPAIATALAEIGIELPAPEALDTVAAEYFEHVLHPRGQAPLVQSLWHGGSYEGEAAVAVRRVAAAAGVELGPGARGAPPDHAGCLLVLWAELRERNAVIANDFATVHLGWLPAAIARSRATGFYAAVLAAIGGLCADLTAGANG
ncbi:MAG: molecular chaperone TorD family protein, partial [Planctomycetes bacterium]|nr:molecular chaperone TorD family protein [Planctomycetota bacterium]